VGVAADVLPKLVGDTSRREQPDLVEMVRPMIEVNPVEALVAATRAMKMRVDSTPLLGTIGCPTLVIGGEEDELMPRADFEAMRMGIPGADSIMIPRAGHLTNLEAPTTFNAAMARFLERCA
jgi:pimeloyl-ACP methyl ester carboxylesterase